MLTCCVLCVLCSRGLALGATIWSGCPDLQTNQPTQLTGFSDLFRRGFQVNSFFLESCNKYDEDAVSCHMLDLSESFTPIKNLGQKGQKKENKIKLTWIGLRVDP